ncbi:DUF4388 domain-containing protein [Desulfobulbus rhabdoformis]|jgi:hypothetical protein|uniref:DUF4388 domain-containing protein n=1 Tax=Desulfobulbus rhabdoformis TaxID=34032 RepID=UPI001965305E|nr:DUF4388 domain-containing protein [Desulfobulbus rhabdoformis]MBM9616531.1 DUF4388 domain-containing protein [Desulfobulbus rhabdoformis]
MSVGFSQTSNTDSGKNMDSIGFQGNIAAVSLDNIFQLIDFASLTGKLIVQAQNNDGNFYFSAGIFVHGTLRVNPHRIGALLLENSVITTAQLEECLQLHEQSSPPQPLGQFLVEKGYVDPQYLDESLGQQVKRAFYESLAWQEGTFAFYPGEDPIGAVNQIQERIDHLLLEGMIYLDNLNRP